MACFAWENRQNGYIFVMLNIACKIIANIGF